MAIGMLPGENILFTSKANAVVVPSDYGLARFAADDLLGIELSGGQPTWVQALSMLEWQSGADRPRRLGEGRSDGVSD